MFTNIPMHRGHALVMALLALSASVDGNKDAKKSQASKDDETAHWKLAALDTAAQEQQIREAEAARDKASTTTVRTCTLVGDAVQAAAQEQKRITHPRSPRSSGWGYGACVRWHSNALSHSPSLQCWISRG